MPSPKSGSPGNIVAPAEPAEVEDADSADPGEVEKLKAQQIKSKKGKYGSTPVKPYKASAKEGAEEDAKKSDGWVEIELVDDNGKPVSGERYEIKLPDGSVASGTTDQNGIARVEGFDPGECQISFPNQEDA
jgi:type VI secretion system secreted protein VgrG